MFHISDLHMRSVDGPQAERARLEAAFRWRVLGKEWEDNLAELRKDSLPFDLVVFTGDLGDWGHGTDYPRAVAFLKATCVALDVPLDRLFVVPGNHDIDRTIQPAAQESLRRDIAKDPRTYSKWMAGEDRGAQRSDSRRDQILERQRAFWGAVATELGRPELGPSQSPHGRLGYRQTMMLPGLTQPIHVIGLDTAWLAGDEHDGGELRLTEHQVALLTTTESGEPLLGLRLALMHHRLADLADAAESRKLLADRVDLLLHGHQHEPTADVLQGPDQQLLVLATGCLYEGDEEHRYANTCQVIDLMLDEHARPRSVAVRFRGWSARGLFWGDDALLYQRARKGRLQLHRGERRWHFDEDSGLRHEHALGDKPEPLSPTPDSLIDFTMGLTAGHHHGLRDERLDGSASKRWPRTPERQDIFAGHEPAHTGAALGGTATQRDRVGMIRLIAAAVAIVGALVAGTLAIVMCRNAGVSTVDAYAPPPIDAASERPPPPGMIVIAAGSFELGSTDDEIEAARKQCEQQAPMAYCRDGVIARGREKPRRTVMLSRFAIDRTELSLGQIVRWLRSDPSVRYDPSSSAVVSRGSGAPLVVINASSGIAWNDDGAASVADEHLPAILLTWEGAQRVCKARGLRLPTEAEWERAGRMRDRRTYPWGNDEPTCASAVFGRPSVGTSEPTSNDPCPGAAAKPVDRDDVGRDSSVEGVRDLAGNVSEWVADSIDRDDGYPACGACVDPRYESVATGDHVVRGGAFSSFADALRGASRVRRDGAKAYYDVGARCAVSL